MIKMVFAFEHDKNTNRFIFGNEMSLPWGHLPTDLKLFKEYTMDKGNSDLNPVLVMGNKTYQSIKDKGIKGRDFWVLSKNSGGDEAKYFNSIEELKTACLEREGNVYVIGGKSVLEEFLDIVDEISLSYIIKEKPSKADTFLSNDFMKNIFLRFKQKEKKIYNKGSDETTFIRMRLEAK